MAATLLSILEDLNLRIRQLTSRNADLEQENAALRDTNEDLRRRAAEADAARDKALLDCEFLAMSHKLADSPDRLVDTRRHIARLIRNIDRCLEMLKE